MCLKISLWGVQVFHILLYALLYVRDHNLNIDQKLPSFIKCYDVRSASSLIYCAPAGDRYVAHKSFL